MPSEPVLDLFYTYKELQTAVKELGAKQVLTDLQDYYPDLYRHLEKEFHHRQKVKELGVLLAGAM